MIVIGITGSIGMGKTTIAQMLKRFNIPIFDSDKEVKDILENNNLVKNQVCQLWPDVILTQVNEKNIKRFDELQRIVRPNPGKELNFLIRRDNEILLKTVIPQLVEGKDASGSKIVYGLLGVVSEQTTFIRHNPLTSFGLAMEETWVIVSQTLIHVTEMIRGERTTEELGGPIRIAKLSGAVADAGLTSSIWFMAVLSINLGLINLFPVPVLDGGHLFFYLVIFYNKIKMFV